MGRNYTGSRATIGRLERLDGAGELVGFEIAREKYR
jgi:hypothetical protein